MIRLFTATDLDVAAQIFVDAFSAPPWNESISAAWAKERLSFLFSLPQAVGKIKEHDGQIVGYWIGYFKPIAGMKELSVEELVVTPHAQSKGIGTELMQNAQAYARDHQADKITLITSPNPKQSDFYSKLGYTADTALVCMGKKLTP